MKLQFQVCQDVCLAAQQLLAGLAECVPVERQDEGWWSCKAMLHDRKFVDRVMQLPAHIDNGRLKKEQMAKCRGHIQAIDDPIRAVETYAASLAGPVSRPSSGDPNQTKLDAKRAQIIRPKQTYSNTEKI